MPLDDSPNSLSRLRRYAVVLLLRKNFRRSFILVLEEMSASIIMTIKIE